MPCILYNNYTIEIYSQLLLCWICSLLMSFYLYFLIILRLWLSSGMQYKLEKNTLQVQTYIKPLYKEEWENKISYTCVCSLMLFRAMELGSGRWSPSVGLLTCRTDSGWTWVHGWSEGSENKGEVCVKCEGVGGVGWGPPKVIIQSHMLLTIQCR